MKDKEKLSLDLLSLPDEISLEIIKKLSIHELVQFSKTHSHLRNIAESVWKDHIFKFFDVFQEDDFFKTKIEECTNNKKTYHQVFFELLEKISNKDTDVANLYLAIKESDAINIQSIDKQLFERSFSAITFSILLDNADLLNQATSNVSQEILKSNLEKDLKLLIAMGASKAIEKILQHSAFQPVVAQVINDEFISFPMFNTKISPIFYAAYLGKPKVIESLVRNGAAIDKRASQNSSIKNCNVMHMAALNNSENSVTAFDEIEKIYNEIYNQNQSQGNMVGTALFLRALDKKRQSILFYAAMQQNFKLMQHIIDHNKCSAVHLNSKGDSAFNRFLNSNQNKITVSPEEYVNYFYSLNPSLEQRHQVLKAFNHVRLNRHIPSKALAIQQAALQYEQMHFPNDYSNLTLKEKSPQQFLDYKSKADDILSTAQSFFKKSILPVLGADIFAVILMTVILGASLGPTTPLLVIIAPVAVPMLLWGITSALNYLNKNDILTPYNISIKTFDFFTKVTTALTRAVKQLFNRSSYQQLPTDTNESTHNIVSKLQKHGTKSVGETEHNNIEMKEHFTQLFTEDDSKQKLLSTDEPEHTKKIEPKK